MMDTVQYLGILKKNQKFFKIKDRTSEEVRSFLVSKGYDENTVEEFLKSSTESSLINDESVFKNTIDLQINSRKNGPERIETILLERGFPKEKIRVELESIPGEVFRKNCLEWIEKKLDRKALSPKEIRSCLIYLSTKGFEEEMILSCLREKGISLDME